MCVHVDSSDGPSFLNIQDVLFLFAFVAGQETSYTKYLSASVHIYIYIYVCMCMCVYMRDGV